MQFLRLFCLGSDLQQDLGDELVGSHDLGLSGLAGAGGNLAGLGLLVAQNQHIGHLFQLRIADLLADLLGSFIQLNTDTDGLQLALDLLGILQGFVLILSRINDRISMRNCLWRKKL